MTGGRPAALLVIAVLIVLSGVGPASGATRSGQTRGPGGPQFVELSVGSISPSTVTAATTDVVVRGSLRNTGDRDVTDLEVRLERATAVATAGELSTALRVTPDKFFSTGDFTRVSGRLAPGDAVGFVVSLPVTGRRGASLALTDPGVYPVLVNVNGTPDFGNPAKLDTAHFLLPVQGVPVQGVPAGTPPAAVTPPSAPEITVLWPLAEAPRLLPVAPGAPALLRDDELATSLAPGGRLNGLLTAATTATGAAADPKGGLRASLCLAVDPDLLVTAEAMTAPGGYLVRTPNGDTTAGTGSPAAVRWLSQLRAASVGSCVVALPWAQADLNASARATLGAQNQIAVTGSQAEVTTSLGINPVAGLVWPTGSALTDATASRLQDLGQRTVLLTTDAVTGVGATAVAATTRSARIPAASGSLGVALLDPLTTAALAATGEHPPTSGDGGGRIQRSVALQDAVGALSWPALVQGSPAATGAPSGVVLAPPQLWAADAAEAAALLSSVGGLLATGRVTARPLVSLLSTVPTTVTAHLVSSLPTQAAEIPAKTVDQVARVASQVNDFAGATFADKQAPVDPATLIGPLNEDLVRSLSTAAGAPPAKEVANVLAGLQAQVQLQTLGGAYTLASENSPLLLVVRNGLPVAVDVRLSVTGPPGLAVTDIGVQRLPASSARQLTLPASVGRTGQFAVDVTLTTAGGENLGPATRVLVRSTAYGTATAIATGAAAVILLLLVARRLFHRVRGQTDPADVEPDRS